MSQGIKFNPNPEPLPDSSGDTLAQRLVSLRKTRHLRQSDAADKLGLSRTTYIGYESLGRTPPWDVLRAIADLYGVSIDYLCCRTDSPTGGTSIIAGDDTGEVTDLWKRGSENDRESLAQYMQSSYRMYMDAWRAWKRDENIEHLNAVQRDIAEFRDMLRAGLDKLGPDVQVTPNPCADILDEYQKRIADDIANLYKDEVKNAIISVL